MKSRYWAILTVVWAFWGMPVLCIGGALEHHCECDDRHTEDRGTSDSPITDHSQSHDSECSHESQCHSDPCSIVVTHNKRISDDHTSLTIIFATPVYFQAIENSISISFQFAIRPSTTQPGQLSLLAADLPLLI